MKNMKLSVKLIGGFILVSVIGAIIGCVGYWALHTAKSAFEGVSRDNVPTIYSLETMHKAQVAIESAERVLVYEKNPDIMKRQYAYLEAAWKHADEGRKIYERLSHTEKETSDWNTFTQDWNAWKKSHEEVIALVRKGDSEAARTLSFGQSRENFQKCAPPLDKLIEHEMNIIRNDDQATEEHLSGIEAVFMILIALGFVISILLGGYLSISINRPLRNIIDGLSDAADQVFSAAGQVSESSQSLAEGASEQAASVEETSSSLEEMASMTKQNATNVGQASSLGKDTHQAIKKANTSMTQLTTSMSEISKASEETSKIIKTIDEIAFQTNLLALNAAVEAARAGEAGAGFAVVADEVRNLAMRAADAAKTTAALIEGTVKKIGDGAALVQSTSEVFGEVIVRSRKVGDLLNEIAAASNEQAQGIDQINIAVTEMDKVTQQNAATAEESASASEELSAQSEEMKAFVSRLASLVDGGAAGPSGKTSVRRPALSGPPHRPHTRTTASLSSKTGAKTKTLPLQTSREVTPNDIIPMDESDFKDF